MCLIYDEKLTQKYKEKTEPIVAYKMVMIGYDQILSPYQSVTIKALTNTSDRLSVNLTNKEKEEVKIENGCHLFLKKKDAISCKQYNTNCHIVKAKIKPQDVVAAGTFHIPYAHDTESIVCLKYHISQKDYKKMTPNLRKWE